MKKIKNEKRVINIPKDQFDRIKKYCEENSLDMVSWVVKNTMENLPKRVPDEQITADTAREIYNDIVVVECPRNWLEIVLKDIDDNIKWEITGCQYTKSPNIYWDGTVKVVNKYRVNQRFLLPDEKIELVKKELERKGFSFTSTPNSYTSATRYSIGW